MGSSFLVSRGLGIKAKFPPMVLTGDWETHGKKILKKDGVYLVKLPK